MKKSTISYLDKRSLIYEGKTKLLLENAEENTYALHFKDSLPGRGQAEKEELIRDKGMMNAQFSAYIFSHLNDLGFPTHWLSQTSNREHIVYALDMFPIMVEIRNAASEDLSRKLGIEEGTFFSEPLVEYYSKLDALNSRYLLTKEHLEIIGLLTKSELEEVQRQALRINDFLIGFFAGFGCHLYNVSFEFGRRYNFLLEETEVFLGDEISLDTCHVVDKQTGQVFGLYGLKENQDIKASLYTDFMERCEWVLQKRNIDENGASPRSVVQLPISSTKKKTHS